ncbi:conserved hypothetical protein [Rubrivivax sp. A210]|uniref:DUF4224 domain-containing protein n=1 Tax=Rubrivivax sp. A210 TaxID=2772301 RepID=UPI001917E754|nr:DUF4224 domain-containing protein [Rubrivivax sp. A210]CAD5374698.1 conserved hypothetical protein [Rubrivivax sp. A210]
MTTETFLSAAELVELTGFKSRHCQARWLDRHRWRYVLNRRNEPRVAREHFAERMGYGARAASHADAINQAAAMALPNFAALDRR